MKGRSKSILLAALLAVALPLAAATAPDLSLIHI